MFHCITALTGETGWKFKLSKMFCETVPTGATNYKYILYILGGLFVKSLRQQERNMFYLKASVHLFHIFTIFTNKICSYNFKFLLTYIFVIYKNGFRLN